MAAITHNNVRESEEGYMAFHRTLSPAMLLLVALSGSSISVRGEEAAQEARIEATLPRQGNFMAVGLGSLWMKSSDKLTRISLANDSITDIPIVGYALASPGWFGSIAVGAAAVWLADRNTIYKIDVHTNQAAKQISADLPEAGQIEFGDGALWAITGTGKNQLRRYGAESGAEEATVALPSRSTAVLAAFGSVWIAGAGNEELYRVDQKSNKIITTIDLRARPGALAAGEGYQYGYLMKVMGLFSE
jgi:virginiamycin B lyase